LARIRNERTRLGTLLDPIADKLLLLSGLILLTGPWGAVFNPHIPIWYVLLVVSRDVLLVLGTTVIHMAVHHVDVRPRFAGKAATFFQMVLICWVLAEWSVRIFPWLLGAAAVCTLISAAQYISAGVRQLEKPHPHESAAAH
jgi:phosphatidylglycerophosphate synthase